MILKDKIPFSIIVPMTGGLNKQLGLASDFPENMGWQSMDIIRRADGWQ